MHATNKIVSARVLTVSPEDWLKKAMSSKSSASRARYARLGLATRAPLDKTTQAMLLRQLYLSLFEDEKFEDARKVAAQAVELGVLRDVLLQDAARAALAQGDLEAALSDLRAAARYCPASRRAFHHWTLGSILFLAQRYEEAESALTRAARWGTHDKPLYRAHLLLCQIASGGSSPDDVQEAFERLQEAPCGQGYGRFVLGHLAYAAGQWRIAQRHLEAFVRKTTEATKLQSLALRGELSMAKATLAKMAAN